MQLWCSKMANTAAAATAAAYMMTATVSTAVRSMSAAMVLAPATCMNRRSNPRCESIYLFAKSGLYVQ
jgi:hypothetical protein